MADKPTMKLSHAVVVNNDESYAAALKDAVDEFIKEGRGILLLGFRPEAPEVRMAGLIEPAEMIELLAAALELVTAALENDDV